MAEVSLIPSWEGVAGAYPYAPGRGDESNEEWKYMRKQIKEARKQMRAEQRAFKQYDKEFKKAEEEAGLGEPKFVLDRDDLPDRNEWWNLVGQYEQPKDKLDFVTSWAGHTGEEVGKYLLGLIGFGEEEEKKADLKPWLEQYIASGGGAGAGLGADAALANAVPFPKLAGYTPNWAKLEEGTKIDQPKYQEQAFNPWNTVANMLMNADWINMDMSRAGKVMQDAFNRRAADNAKVANANEEARVEQQRWQAARQMALEEMKANNAWKQAQLAVTQWQAQQPRALGGNKAYWLDSNGNLHFQQIDKQGEARTVGTNAAMIEMLNLDEKKLKRMTPKKILERANQQALLYPDKDKMPFIQGYILQATQMLPREE